MSDSELYRLISGKLSLRAALEQFLLAKKTEGRTEKTQKFYSMEIGYFVEYSVSRGVDQLQDVTPDLLRQFLAVKGETRNKGGVHAAFRALRAWFLWYENEVEPDNWKNPIRKLKIPAHRPVAIPGISMEDFKKLLAACDRGGGTDIRDQALFRCLLDSCARGQEFVNLDIGDINLTTGDVLIKSGKGGDPRYVQFGSEARKKLRKYLKTRNDVTKESPLFATKAGIRICFNSLDSLLRWRCSQAKIPRPGLHDIRRAGALELLRNGADLAYISKYLGHKSIEVTMRYLAITPDDLREIHRRAGPVDHLSKK